MKLLMNYMGRLRGAIALTICIKMAGALFELSLPYILEYTIDEVVPLGELRKVLGFGALMLLAALATWLCNVTGNRMAVNNAHKVSWQVRQDLFEKTANLSGVQFDRFGLPSLISRMTSDSYNVQAAAQQMQVMCVRSPMLLLGGVCMTLLMDPALAMVLVVMLPLLIAVVLLVSMRGIPVFQTVQHRLDSVVRIMREDITGIRVIKALSKTGYERDRFARANREMMESDIAASTVMAVPGPLMQLCLYIGLSLVVLLGARRVDAGLTRPGVILAFLTYFNMIIMGVMGLSRIFMTLSKASASADRIAGVLAAPADQTVLPPEEGRRPAGPGFIRFEQVDFSYGGAEKALSDISFAVEKGGSLGIIGPTGCGKTTILNLMMRFYDADAGGVFVDGRDVRTYERDELHRKFGAAFQNDMVFQDTLRENIDFGRGLDADALNSAVRTAQAAEYIDGLADGLDHRAAIKGADLSGGQRQRLLVARALAGQPEVLVLDDSSSALDYKTDAAMRRAIARSCPDTTLILIAQRVSSVMNLDQILVLDDGRCIGLGTHAELLESCPAYREICETQMGAML